MNTTPPQKDLRSEGLERYFQGEKEKKDQMGLLKKFGNGWEEGCEVNRESWQFLTLA
jgi:hypothetical protein